MHISIPRRNRRPKEKEQLQVGQDLCKCRGRARVSSGRVGAVVVRILVLAKWAGLTSERQLVGGRAEAIATTSEECLRCAIV